MSGKRTLTCPGCGVFIVMEDATCTIRHPKPQCAVFTALCRRAGLKPRHEQWAEVIDAKTGEVLSDGARDVTIKGAGKA